MPQRNPNRTLDLETQVARRIAAARDARDWSYAELAKRMERVGCAIQPSALFRIEKGDPPRKISVNELGALALVFDIPPQDLLDATDSAAHLDVQRAVTGVTDAMRELNAALADLEETIDGDHVRKAELKRYLADFSDWPELRRVLTLVLQQKVRYRPTFKANGHFDQPGEPMPQERGRK